MKPKKIILNRTEFSSNCIQNRQDFNSILKQIELIIKPPIKRPYFYGAVGFSSLAIAFFTLCLNTQLNEKKIIKKNALKSEKIQPEAE